MLKLLLIIIKIANYIQNHTPHRVLDHITPEEAWSGIKLDVSSFQVFGSYAWAHIPKKKRKALDKKSTPLIFVGYYGDMKAYRLIDPATHDVFFHTHVQFDE